MTIVTTETLIIFVLISICEIIFFMTTLIEVLETCVKRFQKRPAVVFGKTKLSFGELDHFSGEVACGLRSASGITKGDRICLLMTNCLEYAPCFFGVLKTGATAIPINTFLAPAEIRFILEDSRAKAVIVSGDLLKHLRSAIDGMTMPPAIIGADIPDTENIVPLSSLCGRGTFRAQDISPDDTAVLGYTSGTTGIPKGAMLSHGNLSANVADCVRTLRVTKKDRFIVFLPMFHSFTLTVCILTPLAGGGSIHVLKSVKPFDAVLKTLILKRITGFVAIPQIYHLLGERKLPWWLKKLIRIRFCISGSAPLSEEVIRNFERNTGLILMEGYGLTEASPVVSVNPLYGTRKVSSVGPPLPGVRIRIADENGNEVPAGSPGEICIMGPNVMKGYFEKPEETAKVLKNGWLLTGDIGKVDEDGYLYILDRKKDMLKSHGMNVYPREIEQVLYKHPAVKDAAVFGLRDEHRGEVPVAYVTIKEGGSIIAPALVKFCRDKLAPYKIPHKIYIVPDLPRNSTGKILKTELKKQVTGAV